MDGSALIPELVAHLEWMQDSVTDGSLQRGSVVWNIASQEAHEMFRYLDCEALELLYATLAARGRDSWGHVTLPMVLSGSLQQE